MTRSFKQLANRKREHLSWKIHRLDRNTPGMFIDKYKVLLDQRYNIILYFIKNYMSEKKTLLDSLTGKLHALSPQSVMMRGYSITQSLPDESIVMDSDAVKIDQNVRVLLAKGFLTCQVKVKK
jgi:exodeoxyribonuclease VII large subunit